MEILTLQRNNVFALLAVSIFCGLLFPYPALAIVKPPTALGLIGYWSFNEGIGTVATDFSGNQRSGTITGATWINGKRGKALDFDGDDFVQVTGLLGSPVNITITGWAKLDSADAAGAELISLGDHIAIRLDDTSGTVGFFYNGTLWLETITSTDYAGTGWHHFAYVFNDSGNSQKFYVDGVEEGSGTEASSISYSGLGSNTFIGKHADGSTDFDFDGSIDEVRVYNRALSASEVQALYNSGAVRIGGVNQNNQVTSGLVGYWSFNGPDITDNVITDTSVSANHAGFVGGATSTAKIGGRVGQALTFDGINDYVNVTGLTANTFFQDTTFAVSAWVKTTSSSGVIISKGATSGGSQSGWVFRMISPGILEALTKAGAPNAVSRKSVGAVNDGNWHFVVAVFTTDTTTLSNNNASIYIDNVLDNDTLTQSNIPTFSSATVQIGRRPDGSYLNGVIDEVRIYNRALTTTEIRQLYQMGKAVKINPGL
ncbi:MAG: LamG domain-containing protein [bacterium]|nr:LamG domain-containing protein [bacterium]